MTNFDIWWYQKTKTDKTNRIEAAKNDVQKQLNDTNLRIKGEEEQKAAINSQSTKVKADADKLRGEIRTLESHMGSAEEDKMTKDSQIRTLKEEISHQEELIAKLSKDKRSIGDSRQKTEEDIQGWSKEDKIFMIRVAGNARKQQRVIGMPFEWYDAFNVAIL